jgi:hypothetical protein
MGFWKREDDLEHALRAQRPQPSRELVDGIVSRIVRERRQGAGRKARFGVAVALTAGMLATLGAFGGLSYAANGVTNAVSSAVHVIVPAKPVKLIPASGVSSASAQYKVEMCFHGHTLSVDSHAQGALEKNGAKPGPCAGGAFAPKEKLVVACFKGANVSIAKSSTKTKAKRNTLKKLGFTLGYCKA